MPRSDTDLLSWAVEHHGKTKVGRRVRWSIVGALFGLGSTSAISLCRRLGHDPYELLGGETVCECGSVWDRESDS
jgi:hypothetical protein